MTVRNLEQMTTAKLRRLIGEVERGMADLDAAIRDLNIRFGDGDDHFEFIAILSRAIFEAGDSAREFRRTIEDELNRRDLSVATDPGDIPP